MNSKHITVHQTSSEESDNEERRTASLGDLSKFEKPTMPATLVHSQNGTLERAQSLEMSDGSPHVQSKITPKKRKAIPEIENSEFKEPRLSMDLSNLDTLQRGRLKSSYEWGNLEDAIYDNMNGSGNGSGHSDDDLDESKKDSSMITHVLNAADNIDKRGNADASVKSTQVNGDSHVTTKNKKKAEAFSISWDKDENDIEEIPSNLEDTIKHFIETESRNGFHDKPDGNGFNNYSFNDEHISISPVQFRGSNHQADKKQEISVKANDSDQIKIINYGTNMPDDVKVSRYPFGSLERPKSDVLKKLANQMSGEDIGIKTITTNSTSKTTINPESTPTISYTDMQPISLTMIEQGESDLTESSQMSPVFSSDGKGVNSISISSMEVKIRPDSRKDVLPGMLGRENIVTINADGSQPSSIIMIDDEKLDFTLQKLDDDAKPFANNPQKDEVIIIESLSSKKLPEPQTSAKEDVKTFVTEIRVQTPNEELLDDDIDKDDLEALIEAALKNDTSALQCESPLPAYEPIEKSKSPSPTEREYIPRNVEMKFSTSTYESPQRHFEKRHSHIEQIRSAFEKNHSSEIPVLIRKTSNPSTPQRTSPSKIPVFHSKSNDGSTKNGSVTVTSIKNSSRNPSGK